MKLNEWLKSVGYDANDNMIPPPMSAGTAASILADELLGGDGCSFSAQGEQVLAMVVAAVVKLYRPRPGLLTRIRALIKGTKMTAEPSPRPWRVVDPHYEDAGVRKWNRRKKAARANRKGGRA